LGFSEGFGRQFANNASVNSSICYKFGRIEKYVKNCFLGLNNQ